MEVLSTPVASPSRADRYRLPPSPPATVKGSGAASSTDGDDVFGPSCDIVDAGGEGPKPYPLPPHSRKNKVLAEDLKTPDNHVERDPRLIRLTGIHPFNVEAPLSDLFDEGFLTTKDLHYVRNHGYVPRCEDAAYYDWQFSVEGLVEQPMTLTVRELVDNYAQETYPITLVCAGNRRKEQNIVRKSKGFSWGPAGLSTALWTGVPLGTLLAHARPKRGARYVCFEGADKLPNGYYGTSVKLNWAMDPERGMMVAHRMNGEPLHPDHGKPVRIVIPGQIGGRSVKWLRRITVTAAPSDNWYHIYDNRVLPTNVTPEASANLPETWKDERYAIYDLNTNSAMAYPAHDERLPLASAAATKDHPVDGDSAAAITGVYKVRGYAYSGGGKRVTRVELTLDRGRSWRLADVTYPEDLYRLAREGDSLYGGRVDLSWREASFCWCFWALDVPVSDLAGAADIMVRAMDDSMMVQPRDMYWSVLGMMNNPWFRVVIHREQGGPDGQDCLRFEHPSQPAMMPGGWMQRVKDAGGNLTNGNWGESTGAEGEEDAASAAAVLEPVREISLTKPGVDRVISLEELRAHEGEAEPWFVVNGDVFDGTKFLEGHPGGATSIVGAAGQDVSEEFLTIHSENAKAMMPTYHVGRLSPEAAAALAAGGDGSAAGSNTDGPRPIFLDSKAWTPATLCRKRPVSSDTTVFTFSLSHPEQAIGLPVGQHLMLRLRDETTREAIIRAYTPISDCGVARGELDVLVKIYRSSPSFAQGGKMTQALDRVAIGGQVDFKGPVGKFEYLGDGLCAISGRRRSVGRFVMLCAGSGVTPIFQVLRAVLSSASDPATCLVLDGNREESDILCRDELDALAASDEGRRRCRLVYALSRPPPGWTGVRGRISRDLVVREIGGSGKHDAVENAGDLVLVCGPEAMEADVRSMFADMGWPEGTVLFF